MERMGKIYLVALVILVLVLLFPVFLLILPSFGFAKGAKKVIIAFGDSITAGAPEFISPRQNPPDGRGNPKSQYSYWIMKQRPEWTVLNYGINGERTGEMLQRFDSDIIAQKPDIVIIMGGVNDLRQGYKPEEIKRNLSRMYRRAISHDIKFLACTILPYNGAPPSVLQRMKEVNQWIMDYSEIIGGGSCNTYRAMEDEKQPGRLLYTRDGLHPDPRGYQQLAETITECLDAWITEVWGDD